MARLRQPAVLLPAALFVAVLCIYLLSASSDLDHNGDTDLRFQTTQAMVDHRRLWIDHPRWLDSRVASGLGGHLYAFYAPGQTLLMVPFYVSGKFFAHRLHLPYPATTLYAARSLDLFLGSVLALLIFAFGLALGYSRAVALAISLVFAFGSVAWPDAQSALEQTPVELFLLTAVFALWKHVSGETASPRWLAASGLATAAAFCTRYDALIYVPLLALYVLLVRGREGRLWAGIRETSIYAAATLPGLLILAGWNIARFGSPLQTGLHEQTFGGSPISGFLGLAVSPGKGIVWYLPLIFLLPWAARDFARRNPPAAALFALMTATPLIFYSNVVFWHGDPSWGPRYLYTALPYLILPFGEVFSQWKTHHVIIRMAIAAVIAVGLCLQLAAVSVSQWRFWYRLEVTQQRSVDAASWTGQPFHWGASHYHYYWTPGQSPVLIQIDNVYQVSRLTLGDERYRLAARPNPYVSNPADNYPINTFAFWWADVRHPVMGPRARGVIAGTLGMLALLALAVMAGSLQIPGRHTDGLRRDAKSSIGARAG